VDTNLKLFGTLIYPIVYTDTDSVTIICIGRRAFSTPIQIRITATDISLCAIKTQPGVAEGIAAITRFNKTYALIHNEDGSF
jgi:hypothetical protein